MARAMWKGELAVGKDVVPVKLYAAVEDQRVHFRMLHAEDLTPVSQRMRATGGGDGGGGGGGGGGASGEGEDVEVKQTKHAYPLEDGTMVIMEEEDLASIAPEKSRTIEILAVVPKEEVGHLWIDRPYYLGPDEGGDDDYVALAAALGEERAAVVRWTMRNKRYVGAINVEDGHLLLSTLRYADELVAAPEVQAGGKAAPTEKEQKLAEQLINVLHGDFEPEEFEDEYRARVLKFVKAKASGKKPKLPKVVEKEVTGDSLTDALAASLEGAHA